MRRDMLVGLIVLSATQKCVGTPCSRDSAPRCCRQKPRLLSRAVPHNKKPERGTSSECRRKQADPSSSDGVEQMRGFFGKETQCRQSDRRKRGMRESKERQQKTPQRKHRKKASLLLPCYDLCSCSKKDRTSSSLRKPVMMEEDMRSE